ncbi:alpha/beta hydrolase [Nocardioides marmoriginsengisoli]|uniref:Alpha/beta hydrolase n=1 Tax=Nocardioides marmoriginsengisoli TaxID=661483 RepID=A0A3N0CPC9_9ACTN|nr:alpha/beta hydrolase [Nocardioides marmoriginsengisoli]RNL65318.1 alpha/beta hydrolase [Nocardioides marmoriginsengisoli]
MSTNSHAQALRLVAPLEAAPFDVVEVGPRRVPRTEFGGGSVRSSILARAMSSTVKPFISLWARVPLAPWPYFVVDYAGLALRTVPGTTYERMELPHCKAEVLRTPSAEDRVIVYLHGGAFVVGGRFLHRQLMSRIAEETRASVIAVEYRQLPKHPVSASVADALDAYRYVLDSGVPASQVIIMGDSAGGYLTFQTALAAAEAGLPMPAGLVAMSPLIDFDGTAKVNAESAETCALFPSNCFDGLAEVVLRASRRAGEAHALPDPPSRAALHGLPRSLIQASSAEMVFPDAEAMTEALLAAGVDVELQVWDHQVHVFQAAAGLVPEGAQALEELAAFVEDAVPDKLRALKQR